MDNAYYEKHHCCGDGTEGSENCCSANFTIRLHLVKFSVSHCIYCVGYYCSEWRKHRLLCKKKFKLQKKTARLDEINFTRVCLEIEKELKRK